MKVGIMQPYFFPYIGYWQLMNAVDKYVVYDDVNYITRGWITRNRILVNGEAQYFHLPVRGASQNKRINEIFVNHDERSIEKNLRMLQCAYGKAPYFKAAYSLLEEILTSQEENLALFLMESFCIICDYIGITTELTLSSELEKDNNLRGQKKILTICELLGATEYYNAIGGQELYSREAFESRNIHLYFLKTKPIEYKQFGNPFQSNLSIIDVIMFNSRDEIQRMLEEYKCI